MQVLVTGATGYTGPYLLDKLIESGDDVHVLAMPGTEGSLPSFDSVRVFQGSLDDREVLAKATRGVEVVYHLGGLYPGSPVKDLIRVNVGGTRNLLQASVGAGVRRFIYISSVSVYEPVPRGTQISEEHPLRTSGRGLFGNYALTKIAAEKLIRRFHARDELEYVALRPSEIYGPPRWFFEHLVALVAQRPRLALSQAGLYGDMQWIHMNDLVDAMWLAGSMPVAANDKINIAGAECYTVEDLIPIVWRLMGRDNLWINNMGNPASVTEKSRLKFDLSKARRILKFIPKITLEQGLRELVAGAKRKPYMPPTFAGSTARNKNFRDRNWM